MVDFAYIIEPYIAYRVNNRHVCVFARVGDYIAEAIEIFVESLKAVVPVSVSGEHGRVIGLSAARERVRIKMLTHLVYTQKVLHIAHAFKFVRRYVVAGTAESFG